MEINFQTYFTANDHSSLLCTVAASNPTAVWCASEAKSVSSCSECSGGGCRSPGAALENRDTESGNNEDVMWNPQGAPAHYSDYSIVLDTGFPQIVQAVLWANAGDTVHDAVALNVYSSDDAMTWTKVAQLDLQRLVGVKNESVLALPAPFAGPARFWKLNPTGIENQPTPRILGICDTKNCSATPSPTGTWTVGDPPVEDFPINGFAAKWIGNIEIKTGTDHIRIRTHTHTKTHTNSHTHACMHARMHASMHAHTHTHTHTHTLIHTHTHTCTHTHAHTHAHKHSPKRTRTHTHTRSLSAGWYTFYLSSRDGGRLYINDQQKIDSYPTSGGWRKASSEMFLFAGHHALVADMWKAPSAASYAVVKLEYKGTDTYDAIVLVQGVHDPALEGVKPASEEAAKAAMREAKLVQQDEAVLAAARNKGAELAATLARLRRRESKLRAKERMEQPGTHVLVSQSHFDESLLVHKQTHGPLAIVHRPPLLQPQQYVSSPPNSEGMQAPIRRGRSSSGEKNKKRAAKKRIFKKLQWPSYRDDGNGYKLVGQIVQEETPASVLDTERRWGWVKKGLEGYGRREAGHGDDRQRYVMGRWEGEGKEREVRQGRRTETREER